MTLWLAVSPDEYELPLFVSDSSVELGRVMGVSPNSITSAICKKASGKSLGIKFLKVEVE